MTTEVVVVVVVVVDAAVVSVVVDVVVVGVAMTALCWRIVFLLADRKVVPRMHDVLVEKCHGRRPESTNIARSWHACKPRSFSNMARSWHACPRSWHACKARSFFEHL